MTSYWPIIGNLVCVLAYHWLFVLYVVIFYYALFDASTLQIDISLPPWVNAIYKRFRTSFHPVEIKRIHSRDVEMLPPYWLGHSPLSWP